MKKNGKEKRPYHRKPVEPEKRPYVRGRGLLYLTLAEIPLEELESLTPTEVVSLVITRLNESGRTRLEVLEIANPRKLEIREKHK